MTAGANPPLDYVRGFRPDFLQRLRVNSNGDNTLDGSQPAQAWTVLSGIASREVRTFVVGSSIDSYEGMVGEGGLIPLFSVRCGKRNCQWY